MDFAELYRVNLKNEKLRKGKGVSTFKEILGGVVLNDLRPNPHRCRCGNYPKIDRNGDTFSAFCPSKKCNNFVIEDNSTYQSIILKWNTTELVSFDIHSGKIHPLVSFSPGYDSIDFMFVETQKIEDNLKDIEEFELAKKERRLIRLIRSWNRFAIEILPGEVSDELTREDELIEDAINERASKPASISVRDMDDELAISGPMNHRRSEIQRIGSAYYWFVSGHLVLLKNCHKTGWLRPTYLVCIDFKGTDEIHYQVRIDLRTIGIPYFSKMLKDSSAFNSLSSAIDLLEKKLEEIPYVRPLESILLRTELYKKKKFNISDVTNIQFKKGVNGTESMITMTLPAPNEKASARLSCSLGGEYSLSYAKYVNESIRMADLSITHAVCSNDKKYSTGIPVRFKSLGSETQSSIVQIISKEMSLKLSDVAYYILDINPEVRIGYLPEMSLNSEIELSIESEQYQVVSSLKKDGYLKGEIKKHDHLRNANCVNIDSILSSNFESYVYDSNIKYVPGKDGIAMMVSVAGLNSMNFKKLNKLRVSLMSPIEFLMTVKGSDVEISELPEYIIEEKNDFGLSYKNTFTDKIFFRVDFDDWGNDILVATLFAHTCIKSMIKKNKIAKSKPKEIRPERYQKRYDALGLTKDDLDLSNVSFLAGRASNYGIKNFYPLKDRKVKFKLRDSSGKISKTKIYGPIMSSRDLEMSVFDFYEMDINKINSDERFLISYLFENRIFT